MAGTTLGDIPREFGFQGALSSATNTPHTTPVSVSLSLFTTDSGGVSLLSESTVLVPDSKGVFSTTFGTEATIDPELHLGDRLYFEVEIEGDGEPPLSPRLPVVASPLALRAAYAETAAVANGMITASDQEADIVGLSTTEVVFLSTTAPVSGAYLIFATWGENSFGRALPDDDPFVDYRITVNGVLVGNSGTRRTYVDGASSQLILTDADLQAGDLIEVRGNVEFTSDSTHQLIGGRYLLLLRYATP
jgi:hypothetical protein